MVGELEPTLPNEGNIWLRKQPEDAFNRYLTAHLYRDCHALATRVSTPVAARAVTVRDTSYTCHPHRPVGVARPGSTRSREQTWPLHAALRPLLQTGPIGRSDLRAQPVVSLRVPPW